MDLELNGTNVTRPVVRHFRVVAMAFGLWAGLVLLFATQFVLVGSLPWRDACTQAVLFWGVWFLLTPATAWFSFRFPFERVWLVQRLGLHLVGRA